VLAGDLVDPFAMTCHERNAGALLMQEVDEGQAEP